MKWPFILRRKHEAQIRKLREKVTSIGLRWREREARLAEGNAAVHQKDTALNPNEARLRQSEAQLIQKEAQLQRKEASLEQKEARLKEKEAKLRESSGNQVDEFGISNNTKLLQHQIWLDKIRGPADFGQSGWRERWESGRYRRLLHLSVDDAAGSGFRWIRLLNESDQWAARGVVFHRNPYQFPHDILSPPIGLSQAAEAMLDSLISEADLIVVKNLPELFEDRKFKILGRLLQRLHDSPRVIPHFYGSWHRERLDDPQFQAACAKFPAIAYLTPDLRHPAFRNPVWVPHAYPYDQEQANVWNVENRWRVGHSPSNRSIKGTELLRAAVESPGGGTPNWNLQILEGLSSDNVRSRLGNMGLFFDQSAPHFSTGGPGVGWYGNAALEASAIGVPTICYLHAAYLEEASRFIEGWEIPPFFNAFPSVDGVVKALREAGELTDADLAEVSKRNRDWTVRMHGREAILRATNRLLSCVTAS